MTTPFPWTLAARAAKMNPSAIRELLKLTERPGTISLAGGLPSPQTFPIEEFTQACNTVMARDGAAALQYAASEGYEPLRRAVAEMLPWNVDPEQVLITTGSQQALDLIGKVLLDKDSRMLVETPTYLGALQAFAPQEPLAVGLASDDEGCWWKTLPPRPAAAPAGRDWPMCSPIFRTRPGARWAKRAALHWWRRPTPWAFR